MGTEPFRFKQFEIKHDRSAMKVGMDGVLLGAWANCSTSNHILDIGTGTGMIAIMAAQRNSKAIIHGVEIDRESYLQACENVSNSKWSSRIQIFNESIQSFDSGKQYDIILSNPPYFEIGTRDHGSHRDKARNSSNLPPLDLIYSIERLLSPTGSYSMIYPYSEGIEFAMLASKIGLFVTKKTIVRSRAGMTPERLMMQFNREKITTSEDEIVIYKNDENHPNYTRDYISIVKDFYLYM